MATPEYPVVFTLACAGFHGCRGRHTFFVFRQAEEHVPAGYENHVITQILPLYFRFLHYDNVGFQDVKHRLRHPLVELCLMKSCSPRRSASPSMADIQMGFCKEIQLRSTFSVSSGGLEPDAVHCSSPSASFSVNHEKRSNTHHSK